MVLCEGETANNMDNTLSLSLFIYRKKSFRQKSKSQNKKIQNIKKQNKGVPVVTPSNGKHNIVFFRSRWNFCIM